MIALNSGPELVPTREAHVVGRTGGEEVLPPCSCPWLQWKPGARSWETPPARKDFKQWGMTAREDLSTVGTTRAGQAPSAPPVLGFISLVGAPALVGAVLQA